MDLDLDLDLNHLMNSVLDELNQIDAYEKDVLEKEQEEYRQKWACVEMKHRQNLNLQEQLMENLERLILQSKKDATVTGLMQDSLNEIQSTVTRLNELETASKSVVNESMELFEKEWSKMVELQKQLQKRELVYKNLLQVMRLEEAYGERIRKEFIQKQSELENEVHKCESKLHDLQLNATNGNNDVHFNEDA